MKKTIYYLIVILVFTSCNENNKKENNSIIKTKSNEYIELDKNARQLFGTIEKEAISKNNPITTHKVALGKKLYFDKRLSKDNTQSCNTCHNLNTYGVDNQPFSKGNNGGLGVRNSPTTLNAAFHIAQFWDGREPDVEAQAGGPILNPVEMAMPNEEYVVNRLSKIPEYKDLFENAFPDDRKPISYNNLKKAIGAFERKLTTPSRFDDYISGNDKALTDEEKKGLQTFINTGCISCHSGNLLGGNMYQKFGLFDDYWKYTKSKKIDNGRYDVTKNEADKYYFKVPSLRNIEKTYPYFHDGSVNDLHETVKIMGKIQSNKDLSNKEVNEIVVFLRTLTGDIPDSLKE